MPANPDELRALEAAAAERHGVRVWSIVAPTQQELADRIALVLGEHTRDDDELHITHAVVQSGAETKSRRHVLREDETWMELSFEYSAVVVLRSG